MLLSSVIHLKAIEGGALPQYMGAAVRAEFLNWIGETDKAQSDELHDGNELRPYTVSDLKGTFHAQRGFNLVEAGQNAWFRATSLTQELTETLKGSVLPSLRGRVVELNGVKFQVQNVAEAGKHPWAREDSYQSLVERNFKADLAPSDSMEMVFASLTAFHAGDVHMPLPIPETTLGSWLTRWNRMSSASLPRAVEELKEARLALNRYTLATNVAQYKDATWIGFTGDCRIRILSKDEFWLRLCNLLSDFSFYCGTGIKTTFGLGQTRRA
jgi:CRISPR-associated endoribonuclease Cas6